MLGPLTAFVVALWLLQRVLLGPSRRAVHRRAQGTARRIAAAFSTCLKLDSDAPAEAVPRAVLLTGQEAAGKSALAAELARRWGLTPVSLDALAHLGFSAQLQLQQQQQCVAEVLAEARWRGTGVLFEGAYAPSSRDLLDWLVERRHVQVVVWLDAPLQLRLLRAARRWLACRLRLGKMCAGASRTWSELRAFAVSQRLAADVGWTQLQLAWSTRWFGSPLTKTTEWQAGNACRRLAAAAVAAAVARLFGWGGSVRSERVLVGALYAVERARTGAYETSTT